MVSTGSSTAKRILKKLCCGERVEDSSAVEARRAAVDLLRDGVNCQLSKLLAGFTEGHEEESFQRRLDNWNQRVLPYKSIDVDV